MHWPHVGGHISRAAGHSSNESSHAREIEYSHILVGLFHSLLFEYRQECIASSHHSKVVNELTRLYRRSKHDQAHSGEKDVEATTIAPQTFRITIEFSSSTSS
jgi:hypothetical protein